MILERTGDARWCLKDTGVSGDVDVWLSLIEGGFDECDAGFLSGA